MSQYGTTMIFSTNSPMIQRSGEPAYPDGMRLNGDAGINPAFAKRVLRDGHPGQPASRLKMLRIFHGQGLHQLKLDKWSVAAITKNV
jgi:hypothetical protein